MTHIIALNYLWHINQFVIDWAIEHELAQISDPGQCDLVVSLFGEAGPTDFMVQALGLLKDFKCKTITVVVDTNYKKKLSGIFDDSNIRLIFVNQWPVVTKEYTHKPNLQWMPENNVSLLLTGSLLRPHRLGLLKKLYDQNLLDKDTILWSFPVEQKDLVEINNTISKECFTYLSKYAVSLPSHRVDLIGDITGHFDFTHLYGKTNFSIISETMFRWEEVFVTEKVYRAIINKHPFMLVAPAHSLKYLKSFGFRTFEKYLPYKYDTIEDHDQRLKLIINNIPHIQTIISDNLSSIQEDIDFNFNHLMEVVKDQSGVIRQIVGERVSELELDIAFTFKNMRPKLEAIKQLCINRQTELDQRVSYCNLQDWLAFYSNIKADSWPTLTSESDFYCLPQTIQNECINVFQFKPGVYHDPERFIWNNKK